MEWFKEYLLQNWALILILTAFVVMQIITVFLDRKTKRRMYILIGAGLYSVFLVYALIRQSNKQPSLTLYFEDKIFYETIQ